LAPRSAAIALLPLIFVTIAARAADYSLELTPENTKIHFTVDSSLHTVHGTFGLKSGRIEFNTETGKASGQVVVDVASGNTDSDARDSRMHAVVLESKKYPEAVFAPDRVEGPLSVPGTSSVKMHGIMTIHGAAHDITVDVRTSGTEDQFRATIALGIPFVAWGMKDPGNFLLKVNKTVEMTIDTTAALRKR
jgi:polyisoprenoid-binding protein YceI